MVLHNNQIAKLQKDSTELKAYVEEIKQKGDHSLAKKLESKKKANTSIHFNINDMQISEDLQTIVGHICMQWLSEEISKLQL